MNSILQDKKECFICHTTIGLEKHHIFGASNRSKSEKYGLVVYLCHNCHNEPPNGVHHNKNNMLWLHQKGQLAFMKEYNKTQKEFCKEFYRNYL